MKQWIFGYGSLVNEKTWAQPQQGVFGTLKGWRRIWNHRIETPEGFVCSLTVLPAADGAIQGFFSEVDSLQWRLLDAREIGYRRLSLEGAEACFEKEAEGERPDLSRVFVYQSDPAKVEAPGPQTPILQSYIDVVLDGYYRHFGAAGAEAFMNSTDGWERGVRDDRAAPLYPRTLNLEPDFLAYVDGLVDRFGGRKRG